MTFLAALLIGFLQPDVVIMRDALDASLAVLERRAGGLEVPTSAWDSLFSTEGYARLKERERAFRRPFTDSAFRAFLLSDTLLARLPALRQATETWRSIDLTAAVDRARAYLPPGTPIRARLYPLIKPATNSFVHRGQDGVMGIFIYLDPTQLAGELRTTLAHELHHIGYSAACPGIRDSKMTPAERTLLIRLGAFGEGLAMLAAAGSPTVNPNAGSRPQMLADWDRDIATVASDFARIDSLIVDVATRRVTSEDSVTARAVSLYGGQGPWYTVGWLMSSTIERVSGRDRLLAVMCDPRWLILEYSVISSGGNLAQEPLPRWSKTALQWLSGRQTGQR
jgi:hypothetical protein